jgi:protease-4
MALLHVLATTDAAAQDTESAPTLTSARVERPHLPGWSSAGDDGAGAMWSNPANLALDPDPSWIVLGTQQADAQVDRGRSLAFAGNIGALGLGIHTVDSPTGEGWWTLSSGLGLRLDRTVSFGGHLGWHLPEGPDNNFMTGDLSLSWRPTSWVGTSVAVWNVGRWDDEIAGAQVVPGVVFRPWEDKLYLGVDYVQPFPTSADPTPSTGLDLADGTVEGSLRIQAGKGWVVRLSGDQTGRVGAGFELYWGQAGVGGFVDTPIDGGTDILATVYGRTPTGARHKLSTGPRVAKFQFDQAYPYREATGFFASRGETYLHLLSRLEGAARDPSLEGIVIEIDWAPFSFAQIEEIRGRIASMRASGKKVVVYLDRYPDNRTYFLASAADEILLHPSGDLELIGLSAEMQYFRGALDFLGIEPQVAKRSEYKSAPEAMMRTEASGPAREQMNALLDDLSEHLYQAIATDRGWEAEHVRSLIDEGPFTADEALEHRLVDALVYPDEVHAQLDRLFTDRHTLDSEYGNDRDTMGWLPRRELAVITIDGGIVSGESGGPGFFGGGFTAGADTIVRQLQAASSEDSIKAVVLRVDSPGGSSFASDEIWRAVERVKKAGKPVVVSMGSMAASGGYYVAAGADTIVANPSTITGSIGVYAGPKFSLEGLYDKVGIGSELYVRGRNAAMWSMSKPMDEYEFAAVNRLVGHTYAQFKARVGDGRGLDDDQVEAVARGRVWSGVDAQNGGLVDELGGFHDAVRIACEKAGMDVEDVSLMQLYSRGRGGGDVVGRPLGSAAPDHPMVRSFVQAVGFEGPKRPELPELPALAELEKWQSFSGEPILMLMPFAVSIQ